MMVESAKLARIGEGAEGIVYEMLGTEKALKIFFNRLGLETLIQKRKKLNLLKDFHQLSKISALPIETLDEYGFLKGYVMELFWGLNLNEQLYDFNKKLEMLEKIRQALILFKKNGIIYLDLRGQNILCDGENIKFVDMDGAKIGDLPSRINNNYYNAYSVMGGKDNFSAVIYQFNILAYQLLTGKNYTTGFKYMIKKNYEDDLKTAEIYNPKVVEVVEGLISNTCDNTGDNEFIIDFIEKSR